jgi:hypothetical protein
VFFHLNADRDGSPWNTRAVIAPDHGGHADFVETPSARLDAPLQPGTRWPARGVLTIAAPDGAPLRIEIEPLVRFQMRGLGYLTKKWNHVTTSAGETGTGVFEQLIIGPYAPLGLKDYFDHR